MIPDMTFEKIVEKTKLMLGKNYREPEIAEITEAELDELTTVMFSNDFLMKKVRI